MKSRACLSRSHSRCLACSIMRGLPDRHGVQFAILDADPLIALATIFHNDQSGHLVTTYRVSGSRKTRLPFGEVR
jgi:hypothetical protein